MFVVEVVRVRVLLIWESAMDNLFSKLFSSNQVSSDLGLGGGGTPSQVSRNTSMCPVTVLTTNETSIFTLSCISKSTLL
jgi:hypothetical protein